MKPGRIKFRKIWDCFFPDKYSYFIYLGYAHNIYPKKYFWKREYEIIKDFLEYFDSKARPKWAPQWFMRLIELYGNNNSVYGVRSYFFHNLSKKILKGMRITDIKTKWHDWDVRIYGYFTEEIQQEIDRVERKIRNLRELTINDESDSRR